MTYRSAKEENYIAGITRAGEPELAEFTNGDYSGWMYTLNGIHSDLGVKEQYLEDGDEIVFHYTDDYRKEHEHEWSEAGLMTLDPIGMNVCPDMEPVILLIIRKRAAIRSIPMEMAR